MKEECLRRLCSPRNWLMVFGALLMLAGLVSQAPSAQAQDSQQVAQLDFSAFDEIGGQVLSAESRVKEPLSFAAFDRLAPTTAPAGVPALSFAAFDLVEAGKPCACPAECCQGACCCVDGVCLKKPAVAEKPPADKKVPALPVLPPAQKPAQKPSPPAAQTAQRMGQWQTFCNGRQCWQQWVWLN